MSLRAEHCSLFQAFTSHNYFAPLSRLIQPAQQALGRSGHKKKRAREKEIRRGCLPPARPFSLSPTTSKRLPRRLRDEENSLCINYSVKHHEVLCVFLGEFKNGFVIADHMDSSISKNGSSEKGSFTKTTAYPGSPRDAENRGKTNKQLILAAKRKRKSNIRYV